MSAPEGIDRTRLAQAKLLTLQGVDALKQGQLDQAQELFQQAIERSPELRLCLAQLAQLPHQNSQAEVAVGQSMAVCRDSGKLSHQFLVDGDGGTVLRLGLVALPQGGQHKGQAADDSGAHVRMNFHGELKLRLGRHVTGR